MAVTKRDLELLDKRAQLQMQANDEAGTGMSRLIARRQLEKLNASVAAPKKVAPAAPKAVQPAPASTVVPLPQVTSTASAVPPEAQPLADNPIAAPTLDDAARDVAASSPLDPAAASSPLDPVAVAIGQPPKRKKYGLATTTLTGETGLGGSLGNIASKVLLG